MMDLKTPSQWRPELYKPLVSERLNSSHVGFRSLNLAEGTKPKSVSRRVRKLAVTADFSDGPGATTFPKGNNQGTANLGDTLGVNPLVSGVKYKDLGGMYGHFFNDLSPGVKQMVLQKYKDNKHLISQPQGEQDQEALNNAKKLRAKIKMAAAFGQNVQAVVGSVYDVGTQNEAQMLEEVKFGV